MADYLRESGVKWLWEKIKTLLSAKQDKLVSGTNIKTINGTSLLGSGDVSISGGDSTGDVDEGRLVWSDEDSPATLMDIAYLNGNGNKIAGIPPSLVTIEYSADNGATWRDSGISDASKIRLTNHRIEGYAYVRPNGSTTLDINYQTRITIDLIEDSATNAWVGCFEFRKIILKCSGIQSNDTHTMTVEMQKYGSTTWDIIKVSRFWGGPGFFSISMPKRTVGYPSASYYRKVRLTWQTGDVYTNIASINGIFFMSDNTIRVGGGKEPSRYAITGTPYSVDYNQNATFPAKITATKLITKGGTNQQLVLGDGSLIPLSEVSPITDADAEILLDNHIHSIDVNANGNDVNISVIESSKNGNTWETEDNDIPIPLATTTSAGLMSKEDKAKLDDLSVIEIKYTLTEDEYGNHEIVNLYNIVYAISNRLYNNGWLYNDDKSYDVVVKGWVDNRYNAITYANFNVRLLTTQDGHSLGINGYADVAQITQTNENADCPLWVGYICGKYHIEDDSMAFYAPENPNFIVEA